MDLCEGIYDVTSFALNRAYKDVVKPLADIYNKASDIMDKIPTPVKIAAGLVGGAIAIGTGIAPAIVAGAMIKAAASGAVISGAMYGVSSLFTGNFDKKEFVNSMLHGATDMFMISGVTLGVKGVVDCVTRNSGRIREAMLANEEGSTNAVDKLDDFYESRVSGKTNYGKSSENVVKVESGYHQDANGRWHRPNGQFASNGEVGLSSASEHYLHRPYIRQSTIDGVNTNTKVNYKTGQIYDSISKKWVNPENVELGHVTDNEYWYLRDMAESQGMTQAQFNDFMNNSDFYAWQEIYSNRSHMFEKPH